MGLVHDLRNLLQVAASALHIMERDAGRGAVDIHRLTQTALRSIDRAADLSRSILDTSAASDVGSDSVDLCKCLDAMGDLISLTAGSAVAVDLISVDGVPPVRCDPKEFENVVLNLVANARDAMPAGGRVTISLFQGKGRGEGEAIGDGDVLLRVDDTGTGMSDATMRQAFMPFFTTKSAQGGTGLGLATVKSFADRVGGSVTIESAPGKGTSVVLQLPCSDSELLARTAALSALRGW